MYAHLEENIPAGNALFVSVSTKSKCGRKTFDSTGIKKNEESAILHNVCCPFKSKATRVCAVLKGWTKEIKSNINNWLLLLVRLSLNW